MLAMIVRALLFAVILVLIAAFSIWAQQPWLVPSLGSAALLQTLSPNEPSARVWNTIMGQITGEAGGYAGVYLAGATAVPSFMHDHHLAYARLGAVGIAAIITGLSQIGLKALNPAGGATALVVALGAETPTLAGAGRLLLGILMVSVLGEACRFCSSKVGAA